MLLATSATERSRVVDTEAPQPSPGEVQLEVAYTGICGTDLHIL